MLHSVQIKLNLRQGNVWIGNLNKHFKILFIFLYLFVCIPFQYWCKKGRQRRKRQFFWANKQKTLWIDSNEWKPKGKFFPNWSLTLFRPEMESFLKMLTSQNIQT
jgi:hypothetical protein